MSYIYFTILSVFIFTLFLFDISKCQVSWKTSLETGYFNSTGDGFTGEEDIQIKLDGLLKYEYEKKKQNASAYVRVRPEIFGINERMRSVRLKAFGSYNYDFENWVGGLNITSQRHLFSGKNIDINYQSFLLVGDVAFELFENIPTYVSLGNAYHTLSADEQSLDLIFIDTKLNQVINSYLKLGYGMYGEKFSVGVIDRAFYTYKKEKNHGWRFGPKFSVNYLKGLILNFEYRFLLHGSRITHFPSYEHWLRVVAGKIIADDWSIFLLSDYYTRTFKLNNATFTQSKLLYTPMNLENRIYLKLAYEITSKTEFFLKSGYFSESLYKDNLSLKGWNVMVGIEVGSE